eukprot:CAMPEP_0182449328 /NCGR_PEP_ID=MMETSP1172-20130603/33433_1 /TAXON_ID=708627 /ORGANISM="Timspurckia oligopyrenoides, Strain CCMP3278" /LENGTH=492 /DNA_ID=CAMNT_0024646559 /DNA_START=22 /DNA_END=1497 /DNA_ORIENTATION=+
MVQWQSKLLSVHARGMAGSSVQRVIPVSSVGSSGLLQSLVKPLFGSFKSPLPPDYKVDPVLLSQVPTKVSQLSNGMRVATETSKVGTATVGVWIDAGTRYESAKLNGAAHFLEHLIFKGTSKRTQRALEVEVENLGAHLNAYTSREQTVYYARALKADIPQVTELLSDILQNSSVTDEAIDRERDVILREMQEVNGMPEEVLFDYLHATAYQNTPLGKTILGPEENVRTLKRADLMDYVNTHYKPHRMVLVGAGDIEHEELVKLGEKFFGNMPAAPVAQSAVELCNQDPAFLTGSMVNIRNDDMPDAHLAVAFETCGWAHPDAPAFMVMQSLLGGWDRASAIGDVTSNKLAAAMNATTDAHRYVTFNTSYTDTGLFGVYAVGDGLDLDEVAYAMMTHMIGPSSEVDESALEIAKQALKTSLLSNLEGTTGIAENIGRQLLVYGRCIPLAEWFARIDAVDAPALKRIVNKYFYDREIAIAAMGRTHSVPDYSW